jgi:hypothetical protein
MLRRGQVCQTDDFLRESEKIVKNVRWPNFFIVGTARAGTTSLYAHLRQHPEIYASPAKEPHFFAQVRPNRMQTHLMQPVNDRESYLALFKGAAEHHKAIGEASTSYLWDSHAAQRISATVPEAKIIIILRHPIERAFSHYLLDVREGVQRAPFFAAIAEDYASPTKAWGVSHLYVELGLYCEQVKRYLHHFPSEQIHILFFEDMVANEHSCLQRVLSFLDVDVAGLGEIEDRERRNVYAQPRFKPVHFLLSFAGLRATARRLLPGRLRMAIGRVLRRPAEKPRMDPRAIHFLSPIYKPDVACLEELLGTRVPWDIQAQAGANHPLQSSASPEGRDTQQAAQ